MTSPPRASLASRGRRLTWALLPLGVVPAVVLATILGRETVTCPICRQEFEAVVPSSEDTSGGVDRDLFARSAGPQPVFYRISTCPRCYYSGYRSDFGPRIRFPRGFKRRILESPKLDPNMVITPGTDQRMIPALTRYRLAEQCYRWRGMSDEAMAWLCLRASWVARDLGSVIPRSDRLQRVMGFIERWLPEERRGGNQADRELQLVTHVAAQLAEGRFSAYQRPYVEFILAMLWRRHGENTLFEAVYPRGQPLDALPDALAERVRKTRESIAEERRWQRRALEHFLKAVDGRTVTPTNRPAANYLIAELYRRLGERNRAIRHYDAALNDPKTDEHLRTWAREQRSLLEP